MIRNLDTMLMIQETATSDDTSISSTVDACAYLRPQKLQRTAGQKCRRSVSFNETANISYDNTVVTKEKTRTFWYQQSDCQAFKMDHTETAREIIRVELDAKEQPGSYLYVLNQLFDACCSGMEMDTEALAKVLSTERLGLERTSTRSIRMDKKARRIEVVQKVLQYQSDETCSDEERVMKMARVSASLSHVSCGLAAQLAQAQALQQQ